MFYSVIGRVFIPVYTLDGLPIIFPEPEHQCRIVLTVHELFTHHTVM